jgi:hypothetical protein
LLNASMQLPTGGNVRVWLKIQLSLFSFFYACSLG